LRPYGHWYHGYGHHHDDASAYAWLAFTAISLGILSLLSESQQRVHEQAQIYATTAPVGKTINWRDQGASGSVTSLRDGYAESGRYCREFQQRVTIGGRREEAYGTACRQPDGAWQIVDSTG
jgi:surface antigen